MPAKLNLLIPQGSTFRRILHFAYPVTVLSKASNTILNVRPLLIDIPSGTKLRRGDVVLTVAANAVRGARSLQISAYTLAIRAYSQFMSLPVDLSGRTYRASLRVGYGKTPKVDFTCTVDAPTTGDLEIYLSATQTAAFKANCTPFDLPSDLQDRTTYSDALWSKGYVWDLEEVSGSDVFRRAEGKAFVTSEATNG